MTDKRVNDKPPQGNAQAKAAAEARRVEQENRRKDRILQEMLALDKAIRKPPVPPSRRQPKVTRMVSRRQTIVSQGTRNFTKAVYQTPEQAGSNTITYDNPSYPSNATREVGPGDKHNNTYGCHGKETGPTGIRQKNT
jgi:hypothetical protein